MKLKSIITAALALLVSTACNGTKQQQTESSTSNETTAMEKDGKALVVFFSHAGDNYAVGNIEVGNTKIVADYITEFIGGPVWWGTYPQVMFTFFKKHANDLKGKTVIPFTTHEGSGLANCVEDVKAAFPGANVQKGFSIFGHEVRTEKAKVEKWINGLK